MTAITILKDNVPHGPMTRTEVADQLARGEITLESLAFVDGLTQWTPLREVLAKVDALHPPPPAVSALPIGTGYAHTPAPETAAMIGTGYSYAATMQPPEHLVYAGFWRRFGACLIDLVLVYASVFFASLAVGMIVGFVVAMIDRDALPSVLAVVKPLAGFCTVLAFWLYFSLMESSRLQATLGKMALGLLVTDRRGNRIGFGRASGRFFGKIFSSMIFCVGFMLAGWTQRKQALHDMLADTLVVRK